MSIIDDQNKLRQQNIEYLKKFCLEFFNERFNVLENLYKEYLKSKVFDISDLKEVKEFLKNNYKKLDEKQHNQDRFIKNITLENGVFKYSINDILIDSNAKSVIENIYPTLEISLKHVTPQNWIVLINDLLNSTEKIYIKHLLKNYNQTKP